MSESLPSSSEFRLPAEWEAQSAVLMCWPHTGSDWADMLDKVQPCVAEIVTQISRFEKVMVVVDNAELVAPQLVQAGANMQQVQLLEQPSNDTWCRDFGPLTVQQGEGFVLQDFGFNGWGLKFAADQDNQLSRRLHAKGLFPQSTLVTQGLILEGGSIESDGAGTLLTTSDCLLSANRNPHLGKEAIETKLRDTLGVSRVLWLDHGHLAGDDTDSHIDILARLAPENTIIHMHCDDPDDEHYSEFLAMREQLKTFRTASGEPYRLASLPWPSAKFSRHGDRIAPSYANFLIINGAVLVPTYHDEADAEALAVIESCFPDREVIGINCLALLEQGGSLHCMTMQFPEGVL